MTEHYEYTNLMQKLNAAQQEAVRATEGYVRVIAGAGSGKTRALSHRFAFLVNELGILPGNILCVTFTNKSANEMRQRIHSLTGDNDTGYINTFHGFCVSVLQEDSYAAGYPKSFLVLDNSDIDAMLQIIYEERGLTLRDMTFSMARDMIEIQKLFKRPEYYRDMIALPLEALKEKYDAAARAEDIIFFGYLYQEKKCFGLDYNDLIKFTLHIFKEREDIRLKWQQRLEYIMIDEFQDIDALQYELMEALCAWHRNLFVMGDPDQTIYTWRGADIPHPEGTAAPPYRRRTGGLPLCGHPGGRGKVDLRRDPTPAGRRRRLCGYHPPVPGSLRDPGHRTGISGRKDTLHHLQRCAVF